MRRTATTRSRIRRTSLAAACVMALAGMPAAWAQPACPDDLRGKPVGFDIASVEALRSDLGDLAPRTRAAYEELIARADAALERAPVTVTDKERPPPSGDKHDYTSLAPYWWPDPAKPDGMPYVQRDGQINPERDGGNFDKTRSIRMVRDVFDLSLAAYLSGDERYAQKAEEQIEVWFIDPETRMNPNLNFAQSIPGRTDGRGIGIIDSREFQEVVDASLLLESAGALSGEVASGLRQWIGAYAAWLIQSPNGMEERAEENNHGAFYDSQLAHFLIYAGRCDMALRIVQDSKKRTVAQIRPNGFMPEEARRTRSLHYHAFAAEAFLRSSLMAERLGDDLYDYELAASGSVRDVIHNLSKYAGRYDAWPYQRMNDRGGRTVWIALVRSLMIDPDDKAVRRALKRADKDDANDLLLLLAYRELQEG